MKGKFLALPTLHIYLLGDFRLLVDETSVTTVTVPRLQSLLAYLLLHQHTSQDRSHLAFLLWPDSTEAQAHTNLRKALYQLRQALPDADRFLHADKQSLQWLPGQADGSWTLDALEMDQALAQSARAQQVQDGAGQRRALEQVIQLYRGDLLPSCYDEWILPERDRLHQVFLHAAEQLTGLLEEERDYAAALTVAQHLLRLDPLHEATYRQLMRLHALRGDRAAALRVYHTCVTALERELQIEPSEVTQAAYEALLQADSASRPATGPLSSRGAAPALLGRKAEWRQLQEAWRKAAGRHPHMVVLTGEAGIGKTRLAEELEAWIGRQGMTTVSARCYATPGQLAYAPVTSWLRTDVVQAGLSTLDTTWLTELVRLLPDILVKRPKLPRPTTMTEGWQRQQFFEAQARALLSARQPMLLLLDDLQWCDNETLEWLHYLFRFAPEARFLLVGTIRAGETPAGHPLLALLAALQRDGLVTELPLEALTAAETTSLAEQVMDCPLDPAMSATLYKETEGNPLFVVEMARARTLEGHDRIPFPAASRRSVLTPSTSTLPASVQSVLATRLAQLSPLARDVATVAAVIGREFACSVLIEASEQNEEAVVQGLDELWLRRIVREQSTGMAEAAETYDFSHDKLREYVYTSLSPASQRLLHRRIAEALRTIYADDEDGMSGQIAAHYERAGLPERAIPYYQRAGEVACRLYANKEAMSAFGRAAVLLEARAPARQNVPWETTVRLYDALGDVTLELGRYEEARKAYQQAMIRTPEMEHIWRASLLRKVAKTWDYLSTNPHDASRAEAREAFQEAERLLIAVEDPSHPAWRDEWVALQFAQIWPLRGSADDMTLTIEKARPVIEQYGTQEQRMIFSEAIGMRNAIRSRFMFSEEAIAARRAAVEELQKLGDKNRLGPAYLAWGIILMWANHLDEAEEQLETALRMAERVGVAWLQARSLTFMPFIFRKRGQVERVREMLAQAEAVGATQGNSIFTGHYAWLAWRAGNLAEAERYGRRAVEEGQHQQQVEEINPFLWVGYWPLLAVALAQEKLAEAIENARLLLDPTQQPPPAQLVRLFEAAQRAWHEGAVAEARALLQEAVSLAEKMGYL